MGIGLWDPDGIFKTDGKSSIRIPYIGFESILQSVILHLLVW